MIYLGTNEIGHDANELGFPEIHSCQAIIYQTNNILYGWHDSSGSVTQLTAKARNFTGYVQDVDMTHAARAEQIVGVINANNRFSKQVENIWKEELMAVAEQLGFRGPVLGYRVTSHLGSEKLTGRGGGDKMYVRYERDAKTWRVYYKTWHKLNYGAEIAEPEGNRLQFKDMKGTLGPKLYDHLQVVKKDPNSSGKLHKVSQSSFTRFN